MTSNNVPRWFFRVDYDRNAEPVSVTFRRFNESQCYRVQFDAPHVAFNWANMMNEDFFVRYGRQANLIQEKTLKIRQVAA